MSAFARSLFCAALLLTPVAAVAQAPTGPIAGNWYGSIPTPGVTVPLIIHVKADGTATVESPTSPDAKPLPATVSLVAKAVRLDMAVPKASFEGALADDGKTIVGKWLQSGAYFALTLTKNAPAPEAKPNRPQEPKPPFPYRSEDVSYVNPASGLKLAGTLTLPQGQGPFPVALLITGSGVQDRDETLFGHKPFLLIADALTRKGVAVLRVDDRGAGGSARGASAAWVKEFATDVDAGLAFLRARKDIDAARIGLVGHSEGGQVASVVAARDPKVAFVALMAAPGIRGDELLVMQGRALEAAAGAAPDYLAASEARRKAWFQAVLSEPDDAKAKVKLDALLDQQGLPANSPVRDQIRALASSVGRDLLAFQPADYLKSVRAPVLAINGAKDLQVPAGPNLAAIKAALPATTEVTIRELPNLNHLFQTSQTGQMNEYGKLEETMAPSALATIVDWTVAHTARK